MNNNRLILAVFASTLLLSTGANAAEKLRVMITPSLAGVDVLHEGKKVTIQRNQDKHHQIPKAYAETSRSCPPFCVEPMHLAPGVETVGELEVLGYLKRMASGDEGVLVVDSRTPEWLVRGTIPGSVSIPWNKINLDMVGAFDIAPETAELENIMKDQFVALLEEGKWSYDNAKTLVLFCNGPWCPQSALNIKTLLRLGYPANKLKWYRGGMQGWTSFGLTTVKPGH
jgi:rhodanese-related sulfurtransferase